MMAMLGRLASGDADSAAPVVRWRRAAFGLPGAVA